jgi:hypothetical protein
MPSTEPAGFVLTPEQAQRHLPSVLVVSEVSHRHHPSCPTCEAASTSDGGRTTIPRDGGEPELEVDYRCTADSDHDWSVQLSLSEARALLDAQPQQRLRLVPPPTPE